MNLFKIVLTGGPCAGKTKVLEKLIKHYSGKENKVFIVPETATEVLASGLKFIEFDEAINFQDIIMDRQLNKEQTLYRGIKHIPLHKNNIVFLDRGLIDNKAYLNSQKEFDILLCKYNQKELEILDSYDLVIDLISLATTDPELFLKECTSNEERYENLETAQIIDRKTTEAWLGHRNIRYVYPTKNLSEKVDLVITYIDAMLNNKEKKVSEMYLIQNPIDILMLLNDENSKKIEVIDYYLKNKEQTTQTTILRKRIYKDCVSKQVVVIDKDGRKISDKVVNDDFWDFLNQANETEKEVIKTEYTTNILGSVCKINCYEDFVILELPITNYKGANNILTNFSVIERIVDFEEFLENKKKNVPKTKKYGNI